MAEEERIVCAGGPGVAVAPPGRGAGNGPGPDRGFESDPALDERCYGAVWALRGFRFELEYAERVGTRFYFWASY